MNRKYAGQSDMEERILTVNLMAARGWLYLEEPEQYSKYDLKFQKHDKILKIELEHRHEFKHFIDEDGWFNFKYSTIHIPARKQFSEADLYFIFNRDRNQILILLMEQVKKSPIVQVPLNRPDSLGIEDFYDVSLNSCRWKVIVL
jgi:hypothetical protein